MKIQIDPADKMFSLFIRTRDNWTCTRCLRIFTIGDSSLQNSHFFSRGNESVRFDPDDCDSACFGCHRYWETHRDEYEVFKLKQLGPDRYHALYIRAHLSTHKDRKLALITAKLMLIELLKSRDMTLEEFEGIIMLNKEQ